MADKFITAWGFNMNATKIASMDKEAYITEFQKKYTDDKANSCLPWFMKKPKDKQRAILERNWITCKKEVGGEVVEKDSKPPANTAKKQEKGN